MSARIPKKKVYLHIGFFKTGTTAIQEFLSTNRDHLVDKNYYYPDLDHVNHNCLPAMMAYEAGSPVPPVSQMQWCKKGSEEIWNEVITGFEDSSLGNMIISAEMFIDFSCSRKYYKLVDAVAEHLSGYDVTVIIYLRDHLPYIRSMYQEIIKGGNLFHKEEKFLLNQLNGWHMSFYPTVKNWARVFGKENLIVDKYDGGKYVGNGLYRDFVGKIGMKWEDIFRLPENSVNISISREWVEAKRIFNLINSVSNPVRWLMNDQSATPALRDKDIDKINSCIQKDIHSIEGEFLPPDSFMFEPIKNYRIDGELKDAESVLNKVSLLLLASRAKCPESFTDILATGNVSNSKSKNSLINYMTTRLHSAREKLFK